MKVVWSARAFRVTGAALMCVFAVATADRAFVATAAQAGQAPAEQAPLMAENHFKNIQILKGMPVDTFIEAMGMFAASMGGDCTYCHSKDAVFKREAFSVATPRIQRARQMIVMMRTLNNNNFGGAMKVTCFTCHRGSMSPRPRRGWRSSTGPPTKIRT